MGLLVGSLASVLTRMLLLTCRFSLLIDHTLHLLIAQPVRFPASSGATRDLFDRRKRLFSASLKYATPMQLRESQLKGLRVVQSRVILFEIL